MQPSRILPGSKFRIITLAVLAAMTVGGTAIGFGPSEDPNESGLDPIPTSDAPVASTSADPSDDLTAVTTTIVASTDGLEAGGLGDMSTGIADIVPAAEPDIDTQPAPVSGTPVTVSTLVVDNTLVAPIDTATAPTACVPAVQPEEPQAAATPRGEIVGEPISAPADDPAPAAAAWFAESFEEGAATWTPLSGTWTADAGSYIQSDATGYDFISQLPIELPEQFGLSVDLAPVEGALGGGVIIGQPVAGSRRGATLIDFTDGGRFVRWGVYDADTGQYRYVGGVAVGADFDLSVTHRLTLEVRTGRTLVVVDGRALGEFAPVESGGVGLATSLSAVAFDNVEIVEL